MANNILYVSDGDYGTPAGYLLPLMQGQFGQSVPLEIRDLAGNVINLTGYTFTATKRKGSTVTAWVGSIVLSATPTAAPQVTLTVDEDDTGTDGGYYFFLEGTNGSQVLKTHPVSLTVVKDPAVNATPAPGLVSVTTAQKALLATISGLTGLVKMAGGVASAILIKLDGTTAPGVNDDSGDGYGVLSLWVDTTNDNAYICTDATLGAANWEQINGGGGGAVASVFSRTGAVVAESGDYAASQVEDDSGVGGDEATVASTLLFLSDGVNAVIDALGAKQNASTKLSALDALTWAANSIILLTGTATASVQALAAHIVTLLQSTTEADARTAIGAGDVVGPASSTDNAIARYDLATGKLLQGSTATVDDNGSVTLGPGNTTSNSRLIYFPNSAGTVMAEIQVAGGVLRLFPYSGYALQLGVDQNSLVYLTTTNRVGIGQASPGGKLEVNQSGASAAIPPLKLQQADISEEFIRFVGTSANGVLTQSIVEAADVVTPTIAGYVKIFIQDDGNQLTDQAYYMPVYTLA